MRPRLTLAFAVLASLASVESPAFAAEGVLTLRHALQRALASNPRLTAAERDVGIATGRHIQAGALPNPEIGVEVNSIGGTGAYAGTRSAETSIQLGQLVELGGKRSARLAIGAAEVDVAAWQRAALRLEVMSETASAFYSVLGAQRRIQVLDAQIAGLNRLAPLLQRRVEAGASSPAETARALVAGDLVRAERERVRSHLGIARRELAASMGTNAPNFGSAVGNFAAVVRAPSFNNITATLKGNPQLIRWTALRAQRDAEVLAARLKPIPDVRVTAGLRHERDTGDSAMRIGMSIPIPIFDSNRGGIIEAQEARAKVDAEGEAARAALVLTLGRAYEALTGAGREVAILRTSALPNARRAMEAIESGYAQGRFSLLEVLDAQAATAQAAMREAETLTNLHTSVAIIEGLTGMPLHASRETRR